MLKDELWQLTTASDGGITPAEIKNFTCSMDNKLFPIISKKGACIDE